jgi:hypothetical protein
VGVGVLKLAGLGLERVTGHALQIIAERMIIGLLQAGWIEEVDFITADTQVWTCRIT